MINTNDITGGTYGLFWGLGFGIMIFSSIIGLITIISYTKLFTKAGKSWWTLFIPIYNTIVMLEIAKLPIWYIILFFVPIANIYAIFKINIEIAKRFGKDTGFGIGMTLLSIIFIPLLAFSDNKYEDDSVISETVNNQFNANNVVNNNVSVENTNIVAPIANVEVSQPIENVTIENNPFAPVEQVESVSVEPTPISVEPVENVPVEPAPISVEQVESAPVEPVPISVEPVESAPVEPAPVVVEPVINETHVNAFNIAPESNVESFTTETINEPIVPEQLNVNSTEIELATNLAEDKKVCKNCGNELPDIVSICPNCGTDNE